MLLLGVFALGIWLILSNRHGTPTPSVTSAPATSPSPTSPPTSAPPATVTIPSVTGVSYDVAAQRLTALGLVPEQRTEHNQADAGTVLGTDPLEGTTVDRGTHVAIIVSLGPEPSPTTTQPQPSPTAST
jgi:hypothetical protein